MAASWEYWRLSTLSVRAARLAADDLPWATEIVDSRVAEGGIGAVSSLAAIDDVGLGDQSLDYLGTGPIESLLAIDVAGPVVDEVEGWARRNVASRGASLACGWHAMFEGRPRPTG